MSMKYVWISIAILSAIVAVVTSAGAQEFDTFDVKRSKWELSFDRIDPKCVTRNQVLEMAYAFRPAVWLMGTYEERNTFSTKNTDTISVLGVTIAVEFTNGCATLAKLVR